MYIRQIEPIISKLKIKNHQLSVNYPLELPSWFQSIQNNVELRSYNDIVICIFTVNSNISCFGHLWCNLSQDRQLSALHDGSILPSYHNQDVHNLSFFSKIKAGLQSLIQKKP